MLYAIKVPSSGGETLIADGYGAYEALDDATKSRLGGLVALHYYGAASGRGEENIAAPLVNDQQRDKVPPVEHLIARPHPVTGRTALYGIAGTPYGIEGMAEAEATELLAMLKAHMLQDRFIYRHAYRVGDVAIWDTSQTLHSATPIDVATREADSRLLHRISIRGRPRVCH
jgi:taurine dioxygenase